MSVLEVVALFSLGAGIGHVGPRLPTLLMTRAKGFNLRFPPHPRTGSALALLDPARASPAGLLLAEFGRRFARAGLWRCQPRWGSPVFGFGLWVASTWMILSRLQMYLAGRPAPWTKDLAVELQSVMNRSRTRPVAASRRRRGCCKPFPAPRAGLSFSHPPPRPRAASVRRAPQRHPAVADNRRLSTGGAAPRTRCATRIGTSSR